MQNTQNTPQQPAYFAGKYVTDMAELYTVSLVTGNHSVAMGAPGWGKTDIALAVLNEVMPNDFAVVRIQPATTREEVQGSKDMEELLKNSRVVDKVDGTAYDPKWKAIVVDEIGRANKIVVGNLMFLMDRKDLPFAPPILATSNFMPTNPEAEALLDRIGLWYWVKPGVADFAAIAQAQLAGAANGCLRVPGKLPAAQEIVIARHAKPGSSAIKAVSDTVAMVGNEAVQAGLLVNPRRLTQWTKTLYHYSVYLTGQEDFSAVPDAAIKALRFANIAKTQQAYDDWALLIQSMSDPIAAAIEVIMADAATAFNAFVDGGSVDFATAGKVIADKDRELKALGSDPRLAEASNDLKTWFASASRGERINR